MKLAVTGANGSAGRNLLGHIAGQGDMTAVAAVRTPSAAATLPASNNIRPVVVSYRDVTGLTEIFDGATGVVHLAGVLFESKTNSYHSANVDTTAAVVEAARRARVNHLVLVSALGADPQSSNAYLRSKGDAENAVTASGLPATVIRTPLLLSSESAGGSALVKAAARAVAPVPGGGRHRVQPLDMDDLSLAILQLYRRPPERVTTHELAGPEPILYCDLLKRTAAAMGNNVRIVTVPVWCARLLAGINRLVRKSGISPGIIDVITSDEAVSTNADREMGITLTPLSATLEKLIKLS